MAKRAKMIEIEVEMHEERHFSRKISRFFLSTFSVSPRSDVLDQRARRRSLTSSNQNTRNSVLSYHLSLCLDCLRRVAQGPFFSVCIVR